MKILSITNSACLVLGIAFFVSSLPNAQADDAFDVRGGIFGGTAASKGIFEKPAKIPNSGYLSPRQREQRHLPKQGPSKQKIQQLEAALPDKQDSFSVTQEELNAAVRGTGDRRKPLSKNAAMLENARRVMGEARSMLMRSESRPPARSNFGFKEPEPANNPTKFAPNQKRELDAEEASKHRSLHTAKAARPEFSKNPAALTLIIDGKDPKQVGRALEQLSKIEKFSDLAGAQVVLLNYDKVIKEMPEPSLNFRSKTEAKRFLASKNTKKNPISPWEYEQQPEQIQLLERAGFRPSSVVTVEKLQSDYALQTSPTWIVEADGKKHVLAGNHNSLINMFNLKGQFKAPEITGRSVIGQDSAETDPDSDVVHHPVLSGAKLELKSPRSGSPATAVIYSLSKNSPPLDFSELKEELNAPKPVLTVPKLPICAEDMIRRTRIGAPSSQLPRHDIVFFDKTSRAQSDKAAHWRGRTVGYPNGVPQNEISTENMQWTLAQTFAVKCLPTRYRVVEEDGASYFEHLEGRKAWFKDPQ